jgi:hypothetical protein
MKKFGTPIGAGPGSDSENVGFLAEGTPLPLGSVATGLPLPCFFFFCFFWPVPLAGACPCDDGCCDRPAAGDGVVEELVVVLELLELVVVDDEEEDEDDEGEVEVEPEVVVEELVGVLLVVLVVVLELVTSGALDVVVDGAHDSFSDTTTPWIGSPIAEIGVPGGTFTLNV